MLPPHPLDRRRHDLIVAAVIVGSLFVAAAYGPDLGRGFVKDDAPWIVSSRVALPCVRVRGPLLVALHAVVAIISGLEGRRGVGGLCLLVALFAREDALAVPLLAVACRVAVAKGITRRALTADVVWMSIA